MYDGGTALAEASSSPACQTRRGEVVVSAGVHPEYRQVLATESAGYGPRPQAVGLRGRARRPTSTALARRRRRGDGGRRRPAAELLRRPRGPAPPSPSWRTRRARCSSWSPTRSRSGCSRRPARLGADIVVGEAQALGNAMNFGGPASATWPSPRSSCAACPAASSARPSTSRAGAASCSRCRRASSTSAARRRPATSAPTTRSTRWPRWCYLSWLGKEGLPDLGLHCAPQGRLPARAPARRSRA